jgi:hypothetical protein
MSNIIDGEFTEIKTEEPKNNFWLKKLPNWFTIPFFIITSIFLYKYQYEQYQPFVNKLIEVQNENSQIKYFVHSCKCKECKITLKTIRGLYTNNKLDSLIFEI